jgi:nitroimidazol reductase NimA-like FMN-containing flavoprotein (pyridoxamine 5'-phosphate oxidase superfamily)
MTNQVTELSGSECSELLRDHHFGRLAFLDQVGVMPMIIPVNYLVHNDMVVFRTDPGSKLTAAAHEEPVAFEVDGIDEASRTGWSVVVRGHAEQVEEPELSELRQSPLVAWAAGEKPHYVRIQPRLVTGRRISIADLPSNWWG